MNLEVIVDLLTTDAVAVKPHAPVEITHRGGLHDLQGRVRLVEPSARGCPRKLFRSGMCRSRRRSPQILQPDLGHSEVPIPQWRYFAFSA